MASQPFLAEVIIGGFNFSPRGYAFCNGQILSISQNTALFALLGTTYGGNGTSTFALPDFRGRAVLSAGQSPGLNNYTLGELGGVTNETLLSSQMPIHNHNVQSNNGDGDQNSPIGNFFAGPGADRDLVWYNTALTGGTANMAPTAVGFAGSNQPHNNLQPYLVLNYCIALQGIFPARN